jgi:hypothetical protein
MKKFIAMITLLLLNFGIIGQSFAYVDSDSSWTAYYRDELNKTTK